MQPDVSYFSLFRLTEFVLTDRRLSRLLTLTILAYIFIGLNVYFWLRYDCFTNEVSEYVPFSLFASIIFIM